MMIHRKKYDIVIFGGTGLTGRAVVEDLALSVSSGKTSGISWAVSARNCEKMVKILHEIQDSNETGDLSNITVIEADVKDETSLRRMTQQTRVLINCVGPFKSTGEAVILSCLSTHTHYLDMSTESVFLERMQVKYCLSAEEAGVLVVGSCGSKSLVCELGLQFLQKNFPGELVWTESFGSDSGHSGHSDSMSCMTWDTLLGVMASSRELRRIRKTLFESVFEKKTPKYRHKLKSHSFRSHPLNGWLVCVPPSYDIDSDVVRRTQTQSYIDNNSRPVQLVSYVTLGSWFRLIPLSLHTLLFGPLIFLLSSFSSGRSILSCFPRFFSWGSFSRTGPSITTSNFEVVLVGKGYLTELNTPEEEPVPPPGEVTMSLRIKGPEYAHRTASSCINQAAVTLLKERDKIRFRGGILTPGLVFRETSLRQRIQKHGISFDILNSI